MITVVAANSYMDKINTSMVEQNQALVGNLLIDHPQLKEEIIPYITKVISKEAIQLGEETLKTYGYTTAMNKFSQPLLRNVVSSMWIAIFVITGLFTVILVLMIIKEYHRIYSKVNKVSKAAEEVVEGNFNVYLKDEGEGEFNILNHQFNQMTNRLKNSLEILKKEKTFLKNTISDISHQLKTPLASLIMLNDLMLEDKEMDIVVRSTFLQSSKVQLERMEWLIINLLKVARIEAGAIQFKKEQLYLKDIANLALETLPSKYNKDNISIEVSKGLNGVFYGDKEWTIEALINILKNAMEHGDEKESIEIKIEETPLFSNIIIKDYGCGIDPKDLPHIFKRFYSGSTKLKSDSIGIGLNLAKLIIESQKGSISVKSKRGEGTAFTISFLKGIGNLTKK